MFALLFLCSCCATVLINSQGTGATVVTLFEDINYGGSTFGVTVNADCVSAPVVAGFNDRTTSIQLPSTNDCVTLWEDRDCQGDSFNVIGSQAFADSMNDRTSSVSPCNYVGPSKQSVKP
ncbi:hypothetical protein BV898_12786 [Hypsibius exemplaris]|uniref:Beta/gamma crystallin 'Greek key' domain-containing protein n=1 Tax=Hypsibius exemplaris TaxID=2072580 RepID=A0A1W0WCM6_HYPEX|nr:hypothetical protein BV898_12786 [Hypsibius exemplaris]